MYTDEYMKSVMQQYFIQLSKKPVGPGDGWEGESVMPFATGNLKLKQKTKFKELKDEGRDAILDMETELEDSATGGAIKEAKGKYDVLWIPEKGLMRSMKGTTKMAIGNGGQEITYDFSIEVKLAPKEIRKKIEK